MISVVYNHNVIMFTIYLLYLTPTIILGHVCELAKYEMGRAQLNWKPLLTDW